MYSEDHLARDLQATWHVCRRAGSVPRVTGLLPGRRRRLAARTSPRPPPKRPDVHRSQDHLVSPEWARALDRGDDGRATWDGTRDETVTIVVHVNGKVRAAALASPKVQSLVRNPDAARFVYVPRKILNIVGT